MLTYRKFDVVSTREATADLLGWPEPGEAVDDSGLGCNRQYADLRRLSWAEAKRVHDLEAEFIARVGIAKDPEQEWNLIEDELYDEPDGDLYGLDLGVASAVVALSAARCIPFSSCNAGAFGGDHHELYPLVAFYARPAMLDLLLSCAEASDVGLEIGNRGCLVAYADDIRALRRFAGQLIEHRAAFRAVRTPHMPKLPREQPGPALQLSLFC